MRIRHPCACCAFGIWTQPLVAGTSGTPCLRARSYHNDYSRILIILVFYMYYLPIFNNHIIATEYFEYEFKGYIRENIASSL